MRKKEREYIEDTFESESKAFCVPLSPPEDILREAAWSSADVSEIQNIQGTKWSLDIWREDGVKG